MEENLIKIEKLLDNHLKELSIWNLSFQSIYCTLMFMAENIDYKGNTDTALDYVSRTSLIYSLIKKYAKNEEIESTTDSILKTGTKISHP